jgi:hypothetical protein
MKRERRESPEDKGRQEDKAKDKNEPKYDQDNVTRDELLDQLESQVKSYESLPQHVKFAPTSNVDLQYFMLLVLNIFKKSWYR